MIQAIPFEHAPKPLQKEFPDALWFIIEERDEGSIIIRSEALQQLKDGMMAAENLSFVQQGGPRPDGTIIHVGRRIDPIVAGMRLSDAQQQSAAGRLFGFRGEPDEDNDRSEQSGTDT